MNSKKFGLDDVTIKKIHDIFKKFSQIDNVIIYGSRAKGNFKEGSDIDLVLVGQKLTTTDLLKIENEIEDLLLPYKVDLSLLTQIENTDLLEHINRIGKTFY